MTVNQENTMRTLLGLLLAIGFAIPASAGDPPATPEKKRYPAQVGTFGVQDLRLHPTTCGRTRVALLGFNIRQIGQRLFGAVARANPYPAINYREAASIGGVAFQSFAPH
jgi:hypothetical protein